MVRTDPPVSHDELERLAHEYRHAREEHRRARRGSRSRRRLGARVEELRARFDRLLAEAALDEEAHVAWRERLDGAEEPTQPAPLPPLLFRGRSEAGSELRLLARPDGDIDALVDGASVERLASAEELDATEPPLSFRLERSVFHETFTASPGARTALRASLEAGEPPERHAVAELLADGLVDRDLALTPRGRRALALDLLPAHRQPAGAGTLAVRVRGPLPGRLRDELEQALERAARFAPKPPLHAQVSLVHEPDPALERPVVVRAELDLGGRVVRARAAAASATEAIHLLESRLRRGLAELGEREEAARREVRVRTGARTGASRGR